MKRRLLLAAGLALVLATMGVLSSRPRDPLTGRWFAAQSYQTLEFRADGTCQYIPHHPYPSGAWRVIPGPYYARNSTATVTLSQIVGQRYGLGTLYVSPHQLTPEHFQEALAQNAILLTPESTRARLYVCSFGPGPENFELPITLEGDEMIVAGVNFQRQTPENWLTGAWKRLCGLFSSP